MLWKLESIYGEKWEKLDWAAFSALWPLAGPEKPKVYWELNTGPTRLNDDEVMGLLALGMDVSPVPYPGAMIVKMQDRHKWEHGLNVTSDDLNQAKAIHIAIPDFGLLTIKHVEVLEDCCTHQLQGMLDHGWRILAVCPPNAARRPDYIIGHSDGEPPR